MLTTEPQVNCPKGAEAFYNKLTIKDKKLVLYPVIAMPSTTSSDGR